METCLFVVGDQFASNVHFLATDEVFSASASSKVTCLRQVQEPKCWTLTQILADIINFDMKWITTILVEGNFSSANVEGLYLTESTMTTSVHIVILCMNTCVFQINSTFNARYYNSKIKITVENILFVNSYLKMQNVHVSFKSVQFYDSEIVDVSPRDGEFGEIILTFEYVTFEGRSSMTRIYFTKTYKLWIEAIESTFINATVKIASHFVHFGSNYSFYSGCPVQLHSTDFAHVLWKAGSLTESVYEPPIQIAGKRIFLHAFAVLIHNNHGGMEITKSSLRLISSWIQVIIQKCKLRNNTKPGSGGALFFNVTDSGVSETQLSSIQILETVFVHNKVHRKQYDSGFGGAIFLSNIQLDASGSQLPLTVNIKACTFHDNWAAEGGGAIYIPVNTMNVVLSNSDFDYSLSTFGALKGIFIFGRSEICIVSTRFSSKVTTSVASLVELHMTSSNGLIESIDMHVTCLPWHTVKIHSHTKRSQIGNAVLQEMVVYCSDCSPSYYLQSDGKYHLAFSPKDTKINVSQINGQNGNLECIDCPTGANCPGYDLHSKANFWGYSNKKKIMFQQCPLGYCCSGSKTNPCVGYQSCSGNRKGVLCGNCKLSYSLSMLSTNCIPDNKCDNSWMWFVGLLVAFLYMLWYTYKDYVLAGLSKCVSFVMRQKTGKKDEVDKGYFAIVAFYIQASAMMKLTLSIGSTRKVDSVMVKIESYISLLSSIELTNFHTDVCVVKGLNSTHQAILKFCFLLSIYFSWICWFLLLSAIAFVLSKLSGRTIFQRMSEILVNGLVEIFKYTYGGLTDVMFLSITFVTIDGVSVWFYDGNVEIFSSWQIAMVVFGMLFVVPYPFTLYFGLKLMEQGQISGTRFLVSSLFPLPVLIYWSFVYHMKCTKPYKIKDSMYPSKVSLGDHGRTEMLNRFTSGYRETGGAQYWESVLILRRLLLGSTMLISNSAFRMACCICLTIVNLIHHTRVYPFIYPSSNSVETLSLMLLCCVSVINFGKSLFVYFGTGLHGEAVEFIQNFELIESSFPLVLVSSIVLLEIHKGFFKRKTN